MRVYLRGITNESRTSCIHGTLGLEPMEHSHEGSRPKRYVAKRVTLRTHRLGR